METATRMARTSRIHPIPSHSQLFTILHILQSFFLQLYKDDAIKSLLERSDFLIFEKLVKFLDDGLRHEQIISNAFRKKPFGTVYRNLDK